MSAVSLCKSSLLRRGALSALLTLASAILPAVPAPAAEAILVSVDQATLLRIPERVTTVVIGNPLIADISVQPGGLMVVTGKGYGATNIIATDRSGNVVMDRMIQVAAPTDKLVTVHRGTIRESYHCAPDCQPQIVMGDDVDFFKERLEQTVSRSATASAISEKKE